MAESKLKASLEVSSGEDTAIGGHSESYAREGADVNDRKKTKIE